MATTELGPSLEYTGDPWRVVNERSYLWAAGLSRDIIPTNDYETRYFVGMHSLPGVLAVSKTTSCKGRRPVV